MTEDELRGCRIRRRVRGCDPPQVGACLSASAATVHAGCSAVASKPRGRFRLVVGSDVQAVERLVDAFASEGAQVDQHMVHARTAASSHPASLTKSASRCGSSVRVDG